MSFLDKLQSAVGVHAATIQVDVQRLPQKRGDLLQAVIRLTGGRTELHCNFLVITVEYEGEFHMKNAEGGDIRIVGRGYILHDKPQAALDVKLAPEQVLDFPVQVRIPSDSPLSADGIKYKFYTRADLNGVADPEHTTEFTIAAA